MDVIYRKANINDLENLLAIRIKAMKPSLEAIGRFNPVNARKRFTDTFDPETTTIIESKGNILGFFVV